MEFLKRMRAAEFVGFAGGLFATIPTAIWAAIGPVASQLPLSLCNIIITNVPGPQTPLNMLGHKMLSWYPYVPIGGEMGVNTAILSYNGTAYFGFSCDVGAVPDPENLEKFVSMSFAELCESGRKSKPNSAVKPEQKPAAKVKRSRPNAKIPVSKKRKGANGTMPVTNEAKRARRVPAPGAAPAPAEPVIAKQAPVVAEAKPLGA